MRARCAGTSSLPSTKRFVDNDLRYNIGEFSPVPSLHLLSHRLEVALHPVNVNGDTVDQRERLRVFGKRGREGAWTMFRN